MRTDALDVLMGACALLYAVANIIAWIWAPWYVVAMLTAPVVFLAVGNVFGGHDK